MYFCRIGYPTGIEYPYLNCHPYSKPLQQLTSQDRSWYPDPRMFLLEFSLTLCIFQKNKR
jgi:hypothetical protein